MQKLLVLITLLSVLNTKAQDTAVTKKFIDSLCGKSFFGRGYNHNGINKAAAFISTEFQKIGMEFFTDSGYQKFHYPANIIPEIPDFSINGKAMKYGDDFVVHASSCTLSGEFEVETYDLKLFKNKKKLEKWHKIDFTNKFIALNMVGVSGKEVLEEFYKIRDNSKNAKGIIVISEKINWSASSKYTTYPSVFLKKKAFKKKIKKIRINVKNEFIPIFPVSNIIGYIKGEIPDTFIALTAHYDHLGGVGNDMYVPGANDNASGVAMVTDLARYYKQNKPKYSMLFIAFCGEEVGLLGSKHYVENPVVPLTQMKLVINLDMVGTGDDGITLVNGAVIKDLFQKFENINKEKTYLKQVKARGEAANSDHYFFWQKKIPAFFIYTMGGISEYHNPLDKAATLPLTKYKELFSLITDFLKE